MTEGREKIIDGLNDAVRFARGENVGARVTSSIFLPDTATAEEKVEYGAAYEREHAENNALVAAEKLLLSHGYTVTFIHNK